MRKATIIAIVALLLLTALVIGFAINAKIKSKEATQKAFAELKEAKTIEPVINNYYTETVVQKEVNDSEILNIVNLATKEYMVNLKAEYNCQRLDAIDTGDMFLSCNKIK